MRGGEVAPKEPENLEASLAYIDSLPRREVRGLLLPADDRAFYVVWPGRKYYKKRYFEPTGPKYIGASGHEKPAFVARSNRNAVGILVEGELNALSLALSTSGIDVVSPGGSGDFSSKVAKKYLPFVLQNNTIIIMVDADQAGAKACIEAMSVLAGKGKDVQYVLMPKDANQLLIEGGREAVKNEVERVLGRAVG